MYDSSFQRDYVKTELEYRLDRIRDDIVGRRWRRSLVRHGDVGESTYAKTR